MGFPRLTSRWTRVIVFIRRRHRCRLRAFEAIRNRPRRARPAPALLRMHAQAPLSPGYLGSSSAGALVLGQNRTLGGPWQQFWEIHGQMAHRLMVFRHTGSACTSRQDARGRGRGTRHQLWVAWRHYLGVGGVSDAAVT